MPSVESLALTNAIRHAADMRAGCYRPYYNSEFLYQGKAVNFNIPISKRKLMSKSEFYNLFADKTLFLLEWKRIRMDIIYPGSSILLKYDNCMACIKEDKNIGYIRFSSPNPDYLMFSSRKEIFTCQIDLNEEIDFIDEHTIKLNPYIISSNINSIKNTLDIIFNTGDWRNSSAYMKRCQYQVIMETIGTYGIR